MVQLYLHEVVASVIRPAKELKGFKRISLGTSEEKEVGFKLSIEQLAFYDRDVKLIVEPGMFEVMIGSSSRDIRLKDSFEVIGKKEEIISFKTFFTKVF